MTVDTLLWLVIIAAWWSPACLYMRQRGVTSARRLEDSQAEARRWVERLGGQVYSLDPRDDPPRSRRLSDASERFTAAGVAGRAGEHDAAVPTGAADRLRGPVLRPRRARRRSASIPAPICPPSPASSKPAQSARTARSTSRARSTRRRRDPGDGPSTTTRAAWSPVVRCRAAGTPSRGGSLPWWQAPGASGPTWCASSLFSGMALGGMATAPGTTPGSIAGSG